MVLIVDVRRGLEEDDQALIDFIDAAKPPSRRPVQVLLVATKLGKLPRSAQKTALDRLRSLTRRTGFRLLGGGGARVVRSCSVRSAAPSLGEPAREAEGEPPAAPAGPDQNG